ncbi:hypothetical protein LSM04_001844 [Trypanosoma melophagium]|uniref:uncharacterized protein n=1 Tax=Trypanosoma melophagium TaxID=715481 RepID=UPI00351A4F83|nr:hypothetical protein LSM04_001844 [Trypanosoma melophagium]
MRRLCTRLSRQSLNNNTSFVEETLRKHPNSCFSDILLYWHCQSLTPSSSTTQHTIMMNDDQTIKVYDPAEIQLLNKMTDYPFSERARHFLSHHTIAHFAAELGSTYLLELLFSEGVVLHDDNTNNEESLVEKSQRRRVSLENVALSVPNDDGYLISHLAARHGHLVFLKDLVERFGPDTILSQRTVGKKLPFGIRSSLTPYQLSFMYGWVPIMEWIDTSYPMYSFGSMEEALFCVKRASLHSHINSLQYYFQQHGETSHGTLSEGLYPAAEAGAVDVLNFLLETIGESVMWRTCDSGATALHHAARFGRTHLLEEFFKKCDVEKHVDDRDACGRTPAMWCVLGGKKPTNIEFLHQLLQLGSQWPVDVDNEGRDVNAYVKLSVGPTAKIRKFVERCVAQWHEQQPQQRREIKRDDGNKNDKDDDDDDDDDDDTDDS